MTDDLVARLRKAGGAGAYPITALFLEAADRLEAAEARVRALEAELQEACDRANTYFLAERALAEAYERAAKESETCWVTYTGRAGDAERVQIDQARQDIATAIRKLAQEDRHAKAE